jgi:hypothetical protein
VLIRRSENLRISIPENPKLDGQEVDLETALEKTVGSQEGTLISCVPGRLGYFEDEDGRYILERLP